jgi:hypothetical protein
MCGLYDSLRTIYDRRDHTVRVNRNNQPQKKIPDAKYIPQAFKLNINKVHYIFSLVYYFAVNNINLVATFALTNIYTNNKYVFVIYVHLKKYCRGFNYLIF